MTKSRKRSSRKKSVVPRAISPAARGVSFTRSFFKESWAFSPASTAGFWRKITPTLNDIPNAAEYIALFDQYKITRIKITLHPRFGELGAATLNNQFYVTYSTDAKRDYTYTPGGTYNSANYNAYLEHMGQGHKTVPLLKPLSFSWKPTIINDVGGGVNMKTCPWLDTSDSSVLQYGCHMFMHDYNFSALNASTFGCDIQYTLYFQCRGDN